MARIKITTFGGLAPSVDPRNLPPEGAQIAENLDLRRGDFRPTRAPSAPVAPVPAGTVSIFHTPGGQWLSSTTDTDYVNAQVPNATSDRVYLTGRSDYPEAWQDGAYRRLGVPAPLSAPTVLLQEADQFDPDEVATAQEQAVQAVLAAVHANETATLLGNPAPSGAYTPVPTPDPLYSTVALHLRFDELAAGQFVDSSPQKRTVTKEAGIDLSAGTDGPLGAPGNKYGVLTRGATGGLVLSSEIRRWRNETNPRWTIDAWVTSSVNLEWLTIQARDGNMREITFDDGSGNYYTLTAAVSTGLFHEQLRCRRAGGVRAITANTPTLVSVQCTGSTVQVYLDGVLCGSTPNAEGLELWRIGRSHWTASNGWSGKIDEFRVTLEQRYTGDFTPNPTPWSTAAVPTGFWATHGDPASYGLPTDSAHDAAYLVQLSASGGGYVATNPADDYLRTGALGGAQVSYSGTPHWAVPVLDYRAASKAVNQATLESALADIDNPANPAVKLLTAGEAATLAASIASLYDTLRAPLSSSLVAINAAQVDVQTRLATPDGAAALATKISALQSATRAVATYFSSIDTALRAAMSETLGEIFGGISSSVILRDADTRAYIVTFITDWDEESMPSAPSELVEADQNDAVVVSAPSPTPGRNIVGWRLYRATTGSVSGDAPFKLVEDKGASNAVLRDGDFWCFSIGNLSYTDTKAAAELQEPCPSITWEEPPANLRGLVGLPNQMMAGFYDNVLCFCVPNHGYAWPTEYRLSLEYKIVGLGVFGQTVVVCTEGHPYYASGADSSGVSAQKIEIPQSCVSKRSIVAVGSGVIYASPDGLCLAGPGGVEVFTNEMFSREDWQEVISAGCFGAHHDGCYYLFAG